MATRAPPLLAVLVLATAACALPRDPEDTLRRIRAEGVLRAGAVTSAPITARERPLIEAFAAAQGARVAWTTGGEGELLGALKERRLDVVIGGIGKQSPWAKEVGLTRPWGEVATPLAPGEPVPRAIAVPPGENALLTALERHLLAQEEARARRGAPS